VLVVPFVASIAFAWMLSGLLPTVSTVSMAILRWLLIAIASTSVMVAFDRLARRLLPLAALLNLTLAFPDQAPSRFKIAMRTGTTVQLRRVIAEARAGRIGETPAEAAEKLLELVAALSVHDRRTRGHADRVRAYTHMLGEELKLGGAELDHLRWSALLHDIGKLLISAEVLNKTGSLSDAEYEVVKKHPELGRDLVAPLVGWLGDASRAVYEHHERWDGTGYPQGLSGTDISLAGRIVAVTDAYDVMTSVRSYRDPISPVAARAELARCAGIQFDASVVRAFLNVSLGRLRMAMGPLSWLTQLAFVPQALVTAGASGATAVTAIVGLGAGALGVGLSDDGVIAAATTEQTEQRVTDPIDDLVGQPLEVGGTSTGPRNGGDGASGAGVGDDGVPGAGAPIGGGAGTSTTSTVLTGAEATSTTSTVTTGTTVTPGPGATTSTPTTVRSTVAPATTAPAATAPPTTAPGTTAPGTTAPATTAPPETTAPGTTQAPVPPALPSTLMLFLKSPGTGDVASQPVLLLSTETPDRSEASPIPDYDTDRDNNDPGLTLKEKGSKKEGSEQSFQWSAPQALRLRGDIDVVLHARRDEKQGGPFMLDVLLRSCRGTDCTLIAYQRVSGDSPDEDDDVPYVTLNLDLGSIDTELASGDALELLIVAPKSGHKVRLVYDTSSTPSNLVFQPS
jgi:HD domain-containing protein